MIIVRYTYRSRVRERWGERERQRRRQSYVIVPRVSAERNAKL